MEATDPVGRVHFNYVDHRPPHSIKSMYIDQSASKVHLGNLDELVAHIQQFIARVPLGQTGRIVCIFPDDKEKFKYAKKPAITFDLDARTIFDSNLLSKRPQDSLDVLEYVLVDGKYGEGELTEDVQKPEEDLACTSCTNGCALNDSRILERGAFSSYEHGVVRFDLVVPYRSSNVISLEQAYTPFNLKIAQLARGRFDQYAHQMKGEEQSSTNNFYLIGATCLVVIVGVMLHRSGFGR